MGNSWGRGDENCTAHKIQRQVWPVEALDRKRRKMAAVRQALMDINSNKGSAAV